MFCCCARDRPQMNANLDPRTMMQAIAEEDMSTVKQLYQQGFSLEKEIYNNKTVLEFAIEFGSLS